MTEHYLDRLARTIYENWDSPALTDFYLTEDGSAQDTSRGNHYTYGEMYKEILHVCDIFHALGLQKGDHIAICGANSAHWAIAYLAIAAYQGVAVTILYSQVPEDIAHQIDFSDSKALFTDVALWDELHDITLPQVEYVINLDNWQILLGKKIANHHTVSADRKKSPIPNHQCQFTHGNPEELAMICFTSGSTGISKGVMLSYKCVSNNVAQAYTLYPLVANRTFLSLLPYAHMSGLIGDVLSQIVLGRHSCILKAYPSAGNVMNAYRLLFPYMVVCVPQMINFLADRRSDDLDLLRKSCKLIFMGGAKTKSTIEKQILSANIPLSIIYGQTETGASISISPYKQHRLHSCGKIVEGMTARIAPNGEILVKGENVMAGYYKDPEATARKIDKDGWLHTGDKGHLDEDGYLYVEGRLEQDMIVLPNGENIHPEDIERKINALPEVSESILLARNGKLVAIIVPSGVSSASSESIAEHLLCLINPQLPLYSQLSSIEFLDEPLARTAKNTIKRYLYK